jgi:hypothetical protein
MSCYLKCKQSKKTVKAKMNTLNFVNPRSSVHRVNRASNAEAIEEVKGEIMEHGGVVFDFEDDKSEIEYQKDVAEQHNFDKQRSILLGNNIHRAYSLDLFAGYTETEVDNDLSDCTPRIRAEMKVIGRSIPRRR